MVGHFEQKLGLSHEKVQKVKNIGIFMKIQAFYRFYEQNKGFIGLTQNYRLRITGFIGFARRPVHIQFNKI